MEVLLFAVFFIGALVFFISGKDDFGRTESKLTIKAEANIKEKDKVAGEKNIEPQKELKKES